MTAFAGIALRTFLKTDPRSGRFPNCDGVPMVWNRAHMSSDQAHAGTYSLCIEAGGMAEINAVCDAGSRTITVWAYPWKAGAARIEIIDAPAGIIMGSAASAGTGAWEQLSVTFTSLKKTYIVRLSNVGSPPSGDSRCYFDDLEVTA